MTGPFTRFLCATAAGLLVTGSSVEARAQCDTCATPVAAAPVAVAYAPTVTLEPYTGWYPGRMLDRMRMRRWERAAANSSTAAYTAAYAPTYTAAYAPTYTAAYAPTQTAAYTPYNVGYAYTASYAPYVTAYAPLQRNVQTTYYRAAVLRPVAADIGCSTCDMGCSACSTCSSCDPCGGCSSCSGGVSPAAYDAPVSGCASCAAGVGTPSYDYGYDAGSTAAGGASPDYGRQTPQPRLTEPPTRAGSQYGTQRPPTGGAEPSAAESDDQHYPGPADEDYEDADGEASAYPRLLSPVNDRTARAPTVDVWNAVYQKPVTTRATSLRSDAAGPRQRTQAEIDADPWHGVGE